MLSEKILRHLSENNLALQAAALHPAYGHLPWVTEESVRDAVWASLVEAGKQLNKLSTQLVISDPVPYLLSDLRRYWSSASRSDLGADPVAWWMEKKELDALKPLVRSLWCIPASSCSAERLFSFLGHLESRAPQRSLSTLYRFAVLRDVQQDVKLLLRSFFFFHLLGCVCVCVWGCTGAHTHPVRLFELHLGAPFFRVLLEDLLVALSSNSLVTSCWGLVCRRSFSLLFRESLPFELSILRNTCDASSLSYSPRPFQGNSRLRDRRRSSFFYGGD